MQQHSPLHDPSPPVTSSEPSPEPAAAYSYCAFISYNWRDARWARWLQRSLEHYRLPSIARKEVGRDVSLRPVFRYETDLGAADLRRDLRIELTRSRFLIVVCSPNSAFPNVKGEHWVNDEISHFLADGRSDSIIPVIVAGNPDSDGPDRCFPPALLDAGIAGISVKKEGRSVALQKTVAKLLGLRPDILIDRWRRDLRRKRILTAFCFVPALLLAAAAALFAWDSSRTVTADFADYTDSFGLPRGIFRLAPDEIPGRDSFYRFHYRGVSRAPSPHRASRGEPAALLAPFGYRRILRRVEHCGPAGHPAPYPSDGADDRAPVLDFAYDGARLSETRHGLWAGPSRPPHLVKREIFSCEAGDPFPNGLVEFKGERNATFLGQSAHATSESLSWLTFDPSANARTRIAKHRIQRDSRGLPARVSFLDAAGNPLPDGDGIWGWEFLHDDLGRPTEWWYLDENGRRTENRTGVAGRLFRYEKRHLQFTYCVNKNREPVPSHQGWAVCRVWADDLDRTVKARYYDAENNPVASLTTGIAGYDMAYSPSGLRTNLLYVGPDGLPALNRRTLSPDWLTGDDADETRIAGIRSEHDADGNEIRRLFFGTDGRPALCAGGTAGYELEFDRNGNMVRETALGLDGRPVLIPSEGISGLAFSYDSRGLPTNAIVLDLDGAPSVSTDGTATLELAFDEQRNLSRILARGPDGHPTLFEGTAFSGFLLDRDPFGNLAAFTFLGTEGLPAPLEGIGVTTIRFRRDANGNPVRISFHDEEGRPCLASIGIAGYDSEFDRFGRETRRTAFGLDGLPATHSEGYCVSLVEYDGVGRIVRIAYLDTDGRPALCAKGFSSFRSEYDPRGNETRRTFYGTDGLPAVLPDGSSGWTAEYDASGNELSRTPVDASGTPLPPPEPPDAPAS